MAYLYQIQARLDEADIMHRKALALGEKVFGLESPRNGAAYNNYAQFLNLRGQFEQAAHYARRASEVWETGYGGDNSSLKYALNNEALAVMQMGQIGTALELSERSLEVSEPGAPSLVALARVAKANRLLGRQAAAEQALSRLRQALRQSYGAPGSTVRRFEAIEAIERGFWHQFSGDTGSAQKSWAAALESTAAALEEEDVYGVQKRLYAKLLLGNDEIDAELGFLEAAGAKDQDLARFCSGEERTICDRIRGLFPPEV